MMKYTIAGVLQIITLFVVIFCALRKDCTPEHFIIGLLICIILNQWVIHYFSTKR